MQSKKVLIFVGLLSIILSTQSLFTAEEKKRSTAQASAARPASVTGVEIIFPDGQKVLIRDSVARLCDSFNVFYAPNSTFEENESGNFEWPISDTSYTVGAIRIFVAAMVHVSVLQSEVGKQREAAISQELDNLLSHCSIEQLFNVYRFAHYVGAQGIAQYIMRAVPTICLHEQNCFQVMSNFIGMPLDIHGEGVEELLDVMPLIVSTSQKLEPENAYQLLLAPTGNTIVMASSRWGGALIHIWQRTGYNSWKQGPVIKLSSYIEKIAFNSDGNMLAITLEKVPLKIIQLTSDGKWRELKTPVFKDAIHACTWNAQDPTLLALGHESGRISLWKVIADTCTKIHNLYAINERINKLQWNDNLLVALTPKRLLTWRHTASAWKFLNGAEYIEGIKSIWVGAYPSLELKSNGILDMGFGVHIDTYRRNDKRVIMHFDKNEHSWKVMSTYTYDFTFPTLNDSGTMLAVGHSYPPVIDIKRRDEKNKFKSYGDAIDTYDVEQPFVSVAWHNDVIAGIKQAPAGGRVWYVPELNKLSAAQLWLLLAIEKLYVTEEGNKVLRGQLKPIEAALKTFPAYVREFIVGEYLSSLKPTA